MLKTYRFSFIYILLLVAGNFYHPQVVAWLVSHTGQEFANYVIYGLFLAFFFIVLIKTIAAKHTRELGGILLAGGLIFFLLFTHPMLIFRITVLELFILGLLVAWEGKKAKSIVPFLIVLSGAVVLECISNYAMNTHFYYLDAWRHGLVALAGYLPGSLLN